MKVSQAVNYCLEYHGAHSKKKIRTAPWNSSKFQEILALRLLQHHSRAYTKSKALCHKTL